MGKDLKAENLAVSVPNLGCNKNCPYCVSRMTGYIPSNLDLMIENALKVAKVADAAEVTSVLFTGKGEPLLNDDSISAAINLAHYFRSWPLEIQTNGITIFKEPERRTLHRLQQVGFNTVAISIDNYKTFKAYKPLYKCINEMDMIVRLTVNVTPDIAAHYFNEYIYHCAEWDVRQLTFRRITIPHDPVDQKTARWIKKHIDPEHYNQLMVDAKTYFDYGRKIRTLNNGVDIWDINGVAYSFSDYCIQEQDNGDNIRSLIFQEDGHLYTSWNSRASILF